MLTKISDVPDSVLGFRASGELTSDDYRDVLVPAVEAALQTRDKLRLLYLLGDDVTGFSPGAAWQDTKVGMTHPTRWEKDRHRDRQGMAPALGRHLRLPDPG